jgi:unsaturated rhamnogalacturonyl hydrolase
MRRPLPFKKVLSALSFVAIITLPNFASAKSSTTPTVTASTVEQAIASKVKWQLANPTGDDTRSAKLAPLYDGLIDAARATGKSNYLAPVLRLGTQSGWLASDIYNAPEDYAVTRAWLEIYKMDSAQTLRLNPIRDRALKQIDASTFAKEPKATALYANAVTLAKLFAITKDAKFSQALESEFAAIDAKYWDKRAHSFTDTNAAYFAQVNAQALVGLSAIIEALPQDNRANFVQRYQELSTAVLAKKPSNADASTRALYIQALAWGVNAGILPKATTLPRLTLGWQQLATSKDKNKVDATGAFLSASAQLLRALGGASAIADSELLKGANELIAQNSKTPRAYARLVPERADDFAWENDKVAFRVYGPALRAGAEDSGIDAWFKRVPYPILDKWYGLATGKENLTYHQDRGEGYDTFHVGDTRGVGGIGLLVDGKLVTSDTYIRVASRWTSDEMAEFYTLYQYPIQIKGQTLYEHRRTRLHLGQRFNEIQSFFSLDASAAAKPVRDLPYEIVIGVVTQNQANATIHFDPSKGYAAVTEVLDGKALGSAVLLSPKRVLRTMKIDARDKDNKNAHGALVTRLDAKGYLDYRSGFAWSGDGDITTPEQWLKYLATHASK